MMPVVVRGFAVFGLAAVSYGQFGAGTGWSTSANDAQRTSWVRTDPKISRASVAAPGFDLVWKVKLKNETIQASPLSAPVLLDRYIGYRGFRTYAFVGSSSGAAFALDTDLGRIEWEKRFEGSSTGGSATCPGGMTAGLVRPANSALASDTGARYGGMGGRGVAARSGVGEPLEGAVTLAQVMAAPPPPPRPMPTATPGRPGGFQRLPSWLYALSGDGAFHSMYVANGQEPQPPIKFLGPNANVSDLSVVDGVAYATTSNDCGGVPNGVWALDLTTNAVTNWKGVVGGDGEVAFGASSSPRLTSQSQLITLDPKTMGVQSSYDAGKTFTTSPIIFPYKTKVVVGAATEDGVVHVIDTGSPTSVIAKSAAGEPRPYALATWEDAGETRWIIVTSAKSITAWKMVEQGGEPTLEQAWTSREVQLAASPLIINGVLFALQRGDRQSNSVLYALDAATGKPLWNSGKVVSSFVPKGGGLAAGGSSIYFGTEDGTLWDFGFPIEH
jgi:outer membrane protein assembly factor BamB